MTPENLRYTRQHEWLARRDSTVVVGLTDHGQDALGEIIHMELPPVGKRLARGEEAAAVESSKASIGFESPVSGTIVAVNECWPMPPT